MRYLLLLLISTTALAQSPEDRWCDFPKDRQLKLKDLGAVEYTGCVDEMRYELKTLKDSVRQSVASEAIETSDVEKVVNVLDAFSRRLEALENHVTAEEKRIYSNINRVDSKVSEMGSRISTPVDATPYVPPQKAVSTKSNRFESKW